MAERWCYLDATHPFGQWQKRKRESPATGCACTRQRRALTCVSPRKEALRYCTGSALARTPSAEVQRRVLTWRGDVTADAYRIDNHSAREQGIKLRL